MFDGNDAPDFGFDSDEENRIAQELNGMFAKQISQYRFSELKSILKTKRKQKDLE